MNASEVVAEGDLGALEAIADYVAHRAEIRVITEPRPGMVMVRHVDPLQKTPFNMGEAYVTECEVEVDGRLGYGCCLGKAEERSLYAAVVDAVTGGDHPLAAQIAPLLDAEAAAIETRWAAERKAASGTKVDFQVR